MSKFSLLIKPIDQIGVRISSTFSVLRPFSYLRSFLYFDPPTLGYPQLLRIFLAKNFWPKILLAENLLAESRIYPTLVRPKLYFDLNFTLTFLEKPLFRPQLCFDFFD